MSKSDDVDFEVGPPAKRMKCGQEGPNKLICIVHIPGLHYGELLPLASMEEGNTKLDKLKVIRGKRLAQPEGSVHRMEDTCKLIPEDASKHHGYHRVCYQRFTMNLNRLVSPEIAPKPSVRPWLHIFFNSLRRKKIKIKGTWTSEGLSNFEFDGGETIKATAEQKMTRVCWQG